MTIETIDKNACRLIRSELDAALKAIGEKLGVTFEVGNMRYSDSNIRLKLEVNLANGGAVKDVTEQYRETFLHYANLYGNKSKIFEIDAAWLGKTTVINGQQYVVLGMLPPKRSLSNSSKVIALRRRKDGKVLFGSADMVLGGL